jgi:hypothetical protein
MTIWLGMHPSTTFFQIFLPPLLLDSAVRLDFFLFNKVVWMQGQGYLLKCAEQCRV